MLLHSPRRLPVRPALLFALPAAALLTAGCTERATSPRPPAPARVSAAPAAAPPAAPAPPMPASALPPAPRAAPKADAREAPLTVTLAAGNGGRHVRAGSDVTFTAFTALPRGRSATVTLFYQRDRGRRTVFSFAQGSLCSATWWAQASGRYRFRASALDDRRRLALSRSVEITVDRPAPGPQAAAPPPPATVPPPPPATVPPPPSAPRAAPVRPAVARPPVYHVVAAHFARVRNADVLAAALRADGYQAAARRMADSQGKTVYVVETGTYRRPKEVFGAVAKLLRSGYPAYFYASH